MYRDRALTHASRIMLPTYVVLNLIWGLVFVFDPNNRLKHAPALHYARDRLAIDTWGWLFLGLALVMAVAAFWSRASRGVELGLAINAAAWAGWAMVVEKGADLPTVSYLVGVLPMFVAVASVASLASILRNETDRDR